MTAAFQKQPANNYRHSVAKQGAYLKPAVPRAAPKALYFALLRVALSHGLKKGIVGSLLLTGTSCCCCSSQVVPLRHNKGWHCQHLWGALRAWWAQLEHQQLAPRVTWWGCLQANTAWEKHGDVKALKSLPNCDPLQEPQRNQYSLMLHC